MIPNACDEKRITKYKRGQYWIPNYLLSLNEYKDEIIEMQKQDIEKLGRTKEDILRIAKPYLDALLYCNSEEDWALFETFFHTMYANKMEQIEREYYEDLIKNREGKVNQTWTQDVTFYPKQGEMRQLIKYSEFRIIGQKEKNTIRVFGIEDSKEQLAYQIIFKNSELMEHVYLSIISLLESRQKVYTLSDLLFKTNVPVITPNPLQQTANIIKKVQN